MQLIRNFVWWIIGLTTITIFVLIFLLSNLLQGQFWEIPQRTILIVYAALLIGFLNRLSFLRLGETLVHEIGHAQMVALTFGQVKYIRVERDTSGVTLHSRGPFFSRLTTALISLFGPISSAVLFVITAQLVASELTAYWALAIGAFTVLILITTIRNLWGWLTGVTVLMILYLVLESTGYLVPKLLTQSSLITSQNLLVDVILGLCAFNAGSGLRYSLGVRKVRNSNSDEARFSHALFLPTFIGSRLIVGIQLILVWISLSFLLQWPSAFQIGRLI